MWFIYKHVLTQFNQLSIKVDTHEGQVPATSPLKSLHEEDWSQGLVPRTVHTKRFEEQVAGTCPKNSNWFEFVGLVAGTKVFWSL